MMDREPSTQPNVGLITTSQRSSSRPVVLELIMGSQRSVLPLTKNQGSFSRSHVLLFIPSLTKSSQKNVTTLITNLKSLPLAKVLPPTAGLRSYVLANTVPTIASRRSPPHPRQFPSSALLQSLSSSIGLLADWKMICCRFTSTLSTATTRRWHSFNVTLASSNIAMARITTTLSKSSSNNSSTTHGPSWRPDRESTHGRLVGGVAQEGQLDNRDPPLCHGKLTCHIVRLSTNVYRMPSNLARTSGTTKDSSSSSWTRPMRPEA